VHGLSTDDRRPDVIAKLSLKLRNAGLAGSLSLGLVACAPAANAAAYTMYRDADCGCCLAWRDHVEGGLPISVVTQDVEDMPAVKERLGVPDALRSCHTMVVEGYVIEGHVPAEAIARLLEERPVGVIGLAVPGMPVGSPGMEQGSRTQPFQVIAFGPDGYSVFASYP
jgi:hypothetical protein